MVLGATHFHIVRVGIFCLWFGRIGRVGGACRFVGAYGIAGVIWSVISPSRLTHTHIQIILKRWKKEIVAREDMILI